MPFLCVCGSFAVKKKVRVRQKKMLTDFRRADRRFVNFVPKTCVDAIDLFTRHRDLGLNPGNYPECFVHCARALPDEELDKFHRFIVNPNGDIQKGGEAPSAIDQQLEAERQQLLLEATKRDSDALVIPEEDDVEEKTLQEEDVDEKNPQEEEKEEFLVISKS